MESESENQNPPPENFEENLEENLEENPEGEDDGVVEISNDPVASVSPSASAMKRKLNSHVGDYFVRPDNKQRGTECGGGGDETSGNVCEVRWFICGENQQRIGPYTVSMLCDDFSRGSLTASTRVCPEGETEWQLLSAAIPGVNTGISQQVPYDAIGKENVTVSSEVAEPVHDAKRKSPEKPADMKEPLVLASQPLYGSPLSFANKMSMSVTVAKFHQKENMADIKMEPDPVGAAVSNLETNGTAATNIADRDAGAALIDRRERESQDAAVSNLETNGTAATNIADIDAGAALTDRRERELEEELRQKLERKELEDDEQKLIGGFQHMLSNMYLFSNYVLAVSGGALSLLTKGPQCWMFVTIISFVVIFVIAMVLSLQLTYRQLRALQTKMNSLVEKRNQICPDTKNLELEYESRHCDINLLIFLVVGLMYAGFVLVMGYYLLCSESVNGLSYTPCVPGPHQTVPVESVPDHLLVSPWLPRKFLHQAVSLEPVADHVPFSPCVPSLRPCADM